ncbi:MAG: TRAP transporter substrate-binding protein DctP [Deltaproteobacteria bacterium]|nr:TRAP transporter substrate-binding protein DctP [Deltaproteobacteria bacterium]
MKIQSGYPRGDLSMETLKVFAKAAEKRSNGQIKIQVFADPELVPVEELFGATKKGTLDMLHCMGAYWGGILTVGEIEFGLPYMYNIPGNKSYDESAMMVRNFFFKRGFIDLLREEYGKHGLYYLDMHHYGPTFTMATSCIRTLEDFKGKKFRVEGAWHDYYNMLGARGTALSGTDAYMGLKLGTIDASQWDVSCVTGLKWHEVAPYRILGGQNEVQPGHILVNMKRWQSLPDNLKSALAGAAEDYYYALHQVYKGELEKYNELVRSGKIKECRITEEADKAHREAAYKIWAETAKRDPAAAKAIEMVKEWRKTLQ